MEADPRAAIQQREARRAAAPDDLENIVRLGELYRAAWLRDRRAEALS